MNNFIVSDKINRNPQKGISLFYNKNKDRVKCLFWHKNGFTLIYKRIEKGKFYFSFNKQSGVIEINSNEFDWLLAGLDWQRMRQWDELCYDKFG